MASSALLTASENDALRKIASGRNQESLAMAVAMLLVTDRKTDHQTWTPVLAGVVSLVQDFNRRSFFVQVFNVDTRTQAWEQELYCEMTYKSVDAWFHTFEAETGLAGLSFVDQDEAAAFLVAVQSRLEQLLASKQTVPAVTKSELGKSKKKKNKDKGRRKLRREDIGQPTGFIHAMGVRPGAAVVDNLAEVPAFLRDFLRVAKLDECVLQDPNKRRTILTFVAENQVLAQMDARRQSRGDRTRQAPSGVPVKPAGAKPNLRETTLAPPPPPLPPPAPPSSSHSVDLGASAEPDNAVRPGRQNLLDEIRQRGALPFGGLQSASDPSNLRRKRSYVGKADVEDDDASLTSVLSKALKHIQLSASMSSSEEDSSDEGGFD